MSICSFTLCYIPTSKNYFNKK